MKNVTFLACFFICSILIGQNSIPNGNFENWTTIQFLDLDDFVTPVTVSQVRIGSPSTFRSTDRISGNFSVRMETMTNGIDTIFGFITTGEFGQSNGFSFTQSPDSIAGYYKSGVLSGDTAILILRFTNQGNLISDSVYSFVGQQSSWTRFSFPINLSQSPDSLFFGVASSNAINEIGVQPGSWLMLDSIVFTGNGVTQSIPNFNFENWTADSIISLDSWTESEAASRTSDNQEGNFAVRIETVVSDQGDTSFILTNGGINNGAITTGKPFTVANDTLVGFYKYIPSGIDTAAMSLNFINNGVVVSQIFELFLPQTNYTSFDVPFSLNQAPDSMFVLLASSVQQRTLGSALFIDNLILKSIITSLDNELESLENLNIYPNPVKEELTISFAALDKTIEIQVIDGLGRFYNKFNINAGQTFTSVNLSDLKRGIYYLRIEIDGELTHHKFIKN